MHTTAFWLTVPEEVLAGLERSRSEIVDGMFGIAYAIQEVAALHMMCDVRDMGRSVGDKSASWHACLGRGSRGMRYRTVGEEDVDLESLESFQPTIFLYDNYPGGTGFSNALYELAPTLLAATRSLIGACRCPEGCPSCVGPVGEVSRQGKAVALEILTSALDAPSEGTGPGKGAADP